MKIALLRTVLFLGGIFGFSLLYAAEPTPAAPSLMQPSAGAPKKEEATVIAPLSNEPYESVHYRFFITKWKLPFLNDSGASGPFGILAPDKFLFISRCGKVSVVEKRGDNLVLTQQQELPFASEIYCGSENERPLAGTKDMLLSDVSRTTSKTGVRTVYLSYAFRGPKECDALKVVAFDLKLAPKLIIDNKQDIFTTKPCGPKPVTHTQLGGAMAQSGGYVYFSVGDFGHGRSPLKASSFESIFRFKYDAKGRVKVERYATGVRNSEGLGFAPTTKIRKGKKVSGEQLYSTDMGPKGGDEINTVSKGDDFGFSESSYGTEYDRDIDIEQPSPWNQHALGKKPLLAFLPSIAPTAIKYYNGPMFKSWNHSMIMSTLKAQTVFRARLDDNRIIYVEPIAVTKERMRFVHIADDGSIFVKADPDIILRVYRDPLAVAAGPVDPAKVVAAKNCLGCHMASGSGSGIPLVGLQPSSVLVQLNDYATGRRVSQIMEGIAKSLSVKERIAVSDFVTKSPKPEASSK